MINELETKLANLIKAVWMAAISTTTAYIQKNADALENEASLPPLQRSILNAAELSKDYQTLALELDTALKNQEVLDTTVQKFIKDVDLSITNELASALQELYDRCTYQPKNAYGQKMKPALDTQGWRERKVLHKAIQVLEKI